MIFTLPKALYLLSLSLPLTLLYWLIKQEKKFEVSALFLWEEKAGKPQKSSLPKKKLDLLLLLQLLILMLLVFSIAKPALSTKSASGGLVLILDGSASMRKKGTSGTRLYTRAKRKAISVLEEGSYSKVSAFQLSYKPLKLGSTKADVPKIKKAINKSAPTFYSDATLQNLNNILERAKRRGFEKAILLSDKRWEVSIPGMEVDQMAWSGGPNAAITHFSLRKKPRKEDEYGVFLRIKNYSDKIFRGKLVLSSRDLKKEKDFEIGKRETQEYVFSSTADAGTIYKAELEINDSFSPDDTRYAVTEKPVVRRIGWKGKRNESLLQAIKASLPLAKIYQYIPSEYDLVVYNETTVKESPHERILLVNSPMEGLVDFKGSLKRPDLSVVSERDPLIKGVDSSSFSPISVPKVQEISPVHTVLEAEGSPLLFHFKGKNKKIVSFTPQLNRTDLTSSIDFPILIHNILNWLLPSQTSGFGENSNPPGERISTSGWGKIESVRGPEGDNLSTGENFFLPLKPGIYRLKTSSKNFPIPVNVPRDESEIAEKGGGELNLKGEAMYESQITTHLWPVFAAASLVLLLLEALLYYKDLYRWLP